MHIRWNWGTGIILVYSGFVVFMLGMVYLCTRQHFDLVTPDYYEQELKFQQVIDGQKNESALNRQTTIVMNAEQVTVTLPMEKIDGGGKVLFYKPDNARYDFAVNLEAGITAVTVPVSKLKTGLYTIKATWQHDGKPYYNEQSIYVP